MTLGEILKEHMEKELCENEKTDRKELFLRFERLAYDIDICKDIIQKDMSYISADKVATWNKEIRTCAKELNTLFSDTLRFLSGKIV